ncbi:MAG: hypothetical protein IJC33_02875 [Clostridia bacterium]|nr:hypothetical protein [Clostridia bacterium]
MKKNNEELNTFVLSNRFKRKMNRLFREEVGIETIPHPEVDTIWERCLYAVRQHYKKINK